jgi:hypothetical protein
MNRTQPNLQMKTLPSAMLLLFALPGSIRGRLMQDMLYAEMFEKADLVVVAKPVATRATSERERLLGIEVIGVNTEFQTRLVLKGKKTNHKFVLHHYRLAHPNEPIVNGPDLAVFHPSEHKAFLMFLVKEGDGRYAPVSGQVDPAAFSILELNRTAE